jgi:PAS domain S-box-containing protein
VVIDITERKQAEESLRQTAERLSLAQQAGRVGVFDWDLTTNDAVWTPELEEVFGLSRGGFENRYEGWSKRVHPSDLIRIEAMFAAWLKSDQDEANWEYRFLRAGEERWIAARGHVYRDSTGKPIRMIGTNVDITDRKRAEEALKKARDELERRVEERTAELRKTNEELTLFHRFAEASYQGFGMANMDGFFTYMNPSARRIFGVAKPEDIIGKHLTTFYLEEYMLRRETEIFPALLQEGHWEGEVVLSSARKTRHVLQNSFLIKDENGNPTHIASVTTDITDRKLVEEALRRSEERLRLAQQAAQVGTFEWNIQTGLTIWTPELEALYGLSPGGFPGTQGAWENLVYCDDRAEATRLVERALKTGEPVEGEWRVVWPDGSVHWLAGRFQAFKDESGKPLRLIGVNIDITERRKAALALENRLRFEKLLADLSATIVSVSSKNLDEAISRCLENLVEFLEMDRVNVAEFSPDKTYGTVTHSCTASGVDPLPMKVITVQQLPWYAGTLLDGKPVIVRDSPKGLPAEAVKERQMCLMLGIKSIMAFPLRDGTSVVGLIAFSSLRRGCDWQPEVISRLQLVGEVFANALMRKRAEEALERERLTLKHLLQSSDHERQMIAYEIHDGLAQELAGSIMQFQAFDHAKDTKPEDAANAFHAGMTMLQQSHLEARRLISGVRPPILDEAGIVAAVSHLVNEERRKKGPTIEFQAKVEFERLTPILENAIYRIIQESLTNACRHSKTRKVHVELIQCGDQLRIEVRDRGVGFRPEDVGESRFGLEGIRERARLLGGKAIIETKLGRGTKVVVELPIVLRRPEDDQLEESAEWGSDDEQPNEDE